MKNSAEMHVWREPIFRISIWGLSCENREEEVLLLLSVVSFSGLSGTAESVVTLLGRASGWRVRAMGRLSVCPPSSIRTAPTDGRTAAQTEQRPAALGNLRHQTSERIRPRLAAFHINRSRLPACFYSGWYGNVTSFQRGGTSVLFMANILLVADCCLMRPLEETELNLAQKKKKKKNLYHGS